jgi:periplasmic protein TonB
MNTIVPKADRALLAEVPRHTSEDPKQRKLMVGSLCLLLLALSIVLWHDRDFWFPDSSEDADSDQVVESSPAAEVAPVQPSAAPAATAKAAQSKQLLSKHQNLKHETASEAQPPAAQTLPPPAVVNSRTVLPPLEVEVVAGDTHRTLRPGSSSVHVDLQPGIPPQPVNDAAVPEDTGNAGALTNDAAERVQMSPGTSEMVTRPVKPSYPLLARQMKVQGSVILKALISKDGTIQSLRVMSGPHILASAAQDAVRQWHFKPHFEGSEAVETQAKITVNFTISTN